MECPRCQSTTVIKNGRIHNGKAKWMCKDCGRQFVDRPQNQPIPDMTRDLIDRLLQERVSLAAIARITGVSARWLHTYASQNHPKQRCNC
jgi:insertion element IS1 protein InsB